jgi:tripartite-type tricarboxylate transporter receptor subunit TctC
MKTTHLLITSVAALICANPSFAQSYPERPVTWIVPFAAGGPTDGMARMVAAEVSKELKQPIVVENVGGAGGQIGAAKASNAKPDGYTFLVGHFGYMAAAPSLYKTMKYDPIKDFDAVFRFPDTPLVLLVGAGSKYKTVDEMIAFAKANPGKINFGNAGVGSSSHLVAELFAAKAKIKIMQISYKGAGPALNDVMGGQVDAMFDQTNTALPQTKGDKIRALVLTASRTMPQFPNVPTISSTMPGLEASTWYGIYAPKGTPRVMIDTTYKAYQKVMQNKAFTDKMEQQGIFLLPEDDYAPDAFQKFTQSEIGKWADVIKQAGIEPQ